MKNSIGKDLSEISLPVSTYVCACMRVCLRVRMHAHLCIICNYTHPKHKQVGYMRCFTHQVNFNEPLSFLQRLNEGLIYNDVLNQAVKIKRSCEQICYVAAFASSSYASTVYHTGRPFNPLLQETYDCIRRCEMGWRSLSEQVIAVLFSL